MNAKRIFSMLVLLVLMIVSVLYISAHKDELELISRVSLGPIIILFLLVIVFTILNGIKIKLLIGHYNIKLEAKEWFGLSVITTMGNYLTPFRGGSSARAIYLKKIHKLPYSSFLTTFGALYIVGFLVVGVIGIIVSVIILRYHGIFNAPVFSLFSAIAVFNGYIILFSPKLKETKSKFFNRFIGIINKWGAMRKDYGLVSKLIIIEMISILIMSARFFFAFKAFSMQLPFLFALLIALLSSLAMLISITPGALGIREAVIAFSSKLVAISLTVGVSVALLDRAVSMVVIFILGPVFSYLLVNKAKYKLESRRG